MCAIEFVPAADRGVSHRTLHHNGDANRPANGAAAGSRPGRVRTNGALTRLQVSLAPWRPGDGPWSATRSTRQALTWEHSARASPYKIASLAGTSVFAVLALTGCVDSGSGLPSWIVKP